MAVSAHQQVAPVQISMLKLTCLLSNCQTQRSLEERKQTSVPLGVITGASVPRSSLRLVQIQCCLQALMHSKTCTTQQSSGFLSTLYDRNVSANRL